MNCLLDYHSLLCAEAAPAHLSNDKAVRRAQKRILAVAYSDFDARWADAFWEDYQAKILEAQGRQYRINRGVEMSDDIPPMLAATKVGVET